MIPRDKTLFSADAFGTFGALGGNLYADEVNFEADWLPEARRYYANIVGKYGAQVQAVLKKASNLTIERICSLHGPVWRKNLDWYLDKYDHWSAYRPEDPDDILVIYGSLYGHTKNAAEALAMRLADRGARVKILRRLQRGLKRAAFGNLPVRKTRDRLPHLQRGYLSPRSPTTCRR